LQAALEAMQQTVILQDRRVVGRRMLDEIQYPWRTIFETHTPQVMVFPDLWDGMLGWSKHAFNKWRGHNDCIFVGCQYTTGAQLPANCRAALSDAHLNLFTDEALAVAQAGFGRTVLWNAGEPATPLLAAVRDVQQRKPYRANRESRHPYRNV
jgi:hypothetical protein